MQNLRKIEYVLFKINAILFLLLEEKITSGTQENVCISPIERMEKLLFLYLLTVSNLNQKYGSFSGIFWIFFDFSEFSWIFGF
jgi:hypothetical protein